ncbi:MAG TPA: ribosome maturation factor RimM [Pyrinomonadaceae bacterium]|nr:ribosome maturation factor RimM [Pyrinomonadaceae bacterium]
MDELVAVAKVVKPRGIKGEVACDLLTDFPERFDGLENVIAILPDGTRRELKIEEHWFQQDRLVLKFEGVDSMDDAELIRDAEICVREDEVVKLEEGEFFDWQLEGCEVETIAGQQVGKVVELMRTGGTELLVVKGEKEYLVPFANAICVEVDVEGKRIIIDPPDGLLEF